MTTEHAPLPGGMTGWASIGCAVTEPHEHKLTTVTVDLSQPHGFYDYPQVPERLVPPPFTMPVWDQTAAPAADEWCPARDAVSETLLNLGIWEPPETIVMLDVFGRMPNGSLFLDVGAQLGWYSRLAQLSGLDCWLFEADPDVYKVLTHQGEAWMVTNVRISPSTARINPLRPGGRRYCTKIDVEGAEPEAVEMLWPIIEANRMDFMLIELSPTFHDRYPSLVRRLMGTGFDMGTIPDKSTPPATLNSLDDLRWITYPDEAADWVAGQHQINALFARWGTRDGEI